MTKFSKLSLLMLLFILVAPNLLIAESVSAQSIPKPTVPEFTLKYVDHSYDVPPTYETDPYTGKTVLTQAGYHVQNNSVELIIKNQPYHSYTNENGSRIWLYYLVAVKGHFDNWKYDDWVSKEIYQKTYDSYPLAYKPSSESSDTIFAYGLGGDNGTDTAYKYRSSPSYNAPFYYGYFDYSLGNISVGGQVDFRVQAIIGYSTRINTTGAGMPIGLEPGEVPHYYIFTGQSSEWSSTQTVTIGNIDAVTSEPSASSPPLTPTPTQIVTTPQNPTTPPAQSDAEMSILFGLDWEKTVIIALVVVVAALAVGMLVLWRKVTAATRSLAS